MSAFEWTGAVLAAGLMVYLFGALLFPEELS